jgi:hypothetical protein
MVDGMVEWWNAMLNGIEWQINILNRVQYSVVVVATAHVNVVRCYC